MPLLWTLLPNKTTATYTELFCAMCTDLVIAFGDVGANRTFVTNFKLAAINTICTVFHKVTVEGVHFTSGKP